MYADPAMLGRQTLIEMFTPRERLFVDQWCDRYRTLPAKGTAAAVTGKWDTLRTPYLIGMFRAHTNPEVREIAFQKSTQIGATELMIGCSLYDSAHGKTQMIAYPDEKAGDSLSTRRMEPAVRACPPVDRLLRLSRAITTEEIRFKNGSLMFFVSADSRSGMRSHPVGHIVADEIDKWANTHEDGLTNCRSRMRTFPQGTLWKASTPMGDETGITKEYNEADVQHAFQIPCPECGGFFELWDFSMLKWQGGMDTDPEIARRNCWVRCPHCEAKIREENKRWMIRHGLWATQHETILSDGSITETLDPLTRSLRKGCRPIAALTTDFFRSPQEQPDPYLRDQGMEPFEAEELRKTYGITIDGPMSHGQRHGFRCNTMVSDIAEGGWGGLVYEFVQGKGKMDPTWWRDNLGQSPTKAIKRVEASNLLLLCDARANGGHDHGQCPSWTAGCYGGIDIQKDCIKATVWAFSPMMRRSALVLTKRIERREAYELNEQAISDWLIDMMLDGGLPVQTPINRPSRLDQAFEHRRMFPMFLMDTGHYKDEAYRLIKRLQMMGANILACKGQANDQKTDKPFYVANLQHTKNERGETVSDADPQQLVHVNGPYLKEILANRLRPLDKNILGSSIGGQAGGLAGGLMSHTGELIAEREYPSELPGIETWNDDLGDPMYEEVLHELTGEHLTLIGKGSGKSGDDAKGKLRQVWRPVSTHRKNDYWDASVYGWCGAYFAQMNRYTDEEFREQLAVIEAQVQGQTSSNQRRRVGTSKIS